MLIDNKLQSNEGTNYTECKVSSSKILIDHVPRTLERDPSAILTEKFSLGV